MKMLKEILGAEDYAELEITIKSMNTQQKYLNAQVHQKILSILLKYQDLDAYLILGQLCGRFEIMAYYEPENGVMPSENGNRLPENSVSPYFLGAKDGTAYVFHYEPDRATDLSLAFLQTIRAETLPEKPERWVIYADRTLLSDEQMQRLNIVFKRIPRDISKL